MQVQQMLETYTQEKFLRCKSPGRESLALPHFFLIKFLPRVHVDPYTSKTVPKGPLFCVDHSHSLGRG
jgi:hypothetical protein